MTPTTPCCERCDASESDTVYVCANRFCPCHTPATSWPDEFAEEFACKGENCCQHRKVASLTNVRDVQAFIAEKIAQALTAREEELRELIEAMPKEFPKYESNDYDEGYGSALSDVLALLKEKV